MRDHHLLDDPALAAHLRNVLGRVAATTPLDGVEISLDPASVDAAPSPLPSSPEPLRWPA